MTDAGYVAGGYGVTVVAISAYIGYMWSRDRSLARVAARRSDEASSASPEPAPGDDAR